MRLFSVPADFLEKTIDGYSEFNSRFDNARVDETYGQVTGGILSGSGRGAETLPPADLEKLGKYITYCTDRGIGFNYTFNASCLGNYELTKAGFKQINRFLDELWDAGVRQLTISMPQLMTIVRDSKHPFTIKISTICQVNSQSKAIFWKNQGYDKLVIDEDINRDFQKIRQISTAIGDGVEMIVNSPCLKNCPYKIFHYNFEAHFPSARQDAKKFFEKHCVMQKAADWMSPLRLNWVRPEDLGYYESVGVRRFKIQGRHTVMKGEPLRTVEAYMKGSYTGDLCSLINLFAPLIAKHTYQPFVDNSKLDGFLKWFYDNPTNCTGDCATCGHCEAFAEASIDREKAEEIRKRVLDIASSSNPFEPCMEPSLVDRLTRKAAKLMGKKA